MIGLDAPVSADEREEAGGGSLFWREAGDSVDHFRGGMTSIEFGCLAFEPEDLLVSGKGKLGEELFQFGTDGEGPTLDSAVTFIEGRKCLPRGEKPPRGGLRCLRTWWAGFF